MPRWRPGTRDRLIDATVELFEKQGYGATTVAQIAAQAELTKTTFFRQFADKREVLFAGQQDFVDVITEAIAEAPADASPLATVAHALARLTQTFTAEQRLRGPRLERIVAGNSDLQERAAYKQHSLGQAMVTALLARGVPDARAAVAADLGVRAFYDGFREWTADARDVPLDDLVLARLSVLREAAAEVARDDLS